MSRIYKLRKTTQTMNLTKYVVQYDFKNLPMAVALANLTQYVINTLLYIYVAYLDKYT